MMLNLFETNIVVAGREPLLYSRLNSLKKESKIKTNVRMKIDGKSLLHLILASSTFEQHYFVSQHLILSENSCTNLAVFFLINYRQIRM